MKHGENSTSEQDIPSSIIVIGDNLLIKPHPQSVIDGWKEALDEFHLIADDGSKQILSQYQKKCILRAKDKISGLKKMILEHPQNKDNLIKSFKESHTYNSFIDSFAIPETPNQSIAMAFQLGLQKSLNLEQLDNANRLYLKGFHTASMKTADYATEFANGLLKFASELNIPIIRVERKRKSFPSAANYEYMIELMNEEDEKLKSAIDLTETIKMINIGLDYTTNEYTKNLTEALELIDPSPTRLKSFIFIPIDRLGILESATQSADYENKILNPLRTLKSRVFVICPNTASKSMDLTNYKDFDIKMLRESEAIEFLNHLLTTKDSATDSVGPSGTIRVQAAERPASSQVNQNESQQL